MKDNKVSSPGDSRISSLVEQARRGDQEAYTALYRETCQEVFRIIRSMVRTEEEAMDIQQDTYVYAFTHLDALGEPAKLRAWLRAIAVSTTRSALRKQTPVLFSELETEEPFPELWEASAEESPELKLERKETAEYVREILEDLSPGQRMLVGMYYYGQRSVAEISRELDVSSGTVKTQLFRARKKIEAAVKRLEERGVSLFGLAPLPFLTALLKNLTPAAEQSKTAMTAAMTRSGISAATKTAAVHVGRRFFQTAIGKVVLGVLAAAVVGGGVAGYRWLRDHANYGDVRPSETVESTEDLTTEPVNTEPVTTEPITTEPVTTEPVTTEPVTTEPESTEPKTTQPKPTDPEPSVPPSSEAAAKPTTEPSAEPTTEPGAEPSQDADQTDPDPTDQSLQDTTEPERTELIRVFWTNDDSAEDLEYQWSKIHTKSYLCLITRGSETPVVYTDQSQMLQISFWGDDPTGQTPEGYRVHYWTVSVNDYGTANLYCQLNGSAQMIDTISIQREKPKVISYQWDSADGETHEAPTDVEVKAGDFANFSIWFTGMERSELSDAKLIQTDRPDWSLHLEGTSMTEDGTVSGYWSVLPADGSCSIRCVLNGETVFTIRVTVVP